MIIDTIQKQIFDAMKAGDGDRVSTWKLLSSELHNFQIDHPQMTPEDELAIVKREVKKRKDAIELYEKGKALEKAEKEKKELAILTRFLPEELGDAQLEELVNEVISEMGAVELSDMGRVIGGVVKKAAGRADGGRVAQLVKSKLS